MAERIEAELEFEEQLEVLRLLKRLSHDIRGEVFSFIDWPEEIRRERKIRLLGALVDVSRQQLRGTRREEKLLQLLWDIGP